MIKARHAVGKILTACLFLAQVISLTAEEEGGLHTLFADPPVEYRPGVFWEWCNGNINRASITSDLEAMKRVGIQGGKVFNVSGPEGPVRFASKEWFDLMAFACEEAGRLDMVIGLNITEGFNAAGGPWITPDKSMQQVTWSETDVSGPGPVRVQLEKPEPIYNKEINKHFPPKGMKERAFEFYEDIRVYAVPAGGKGRIAEYREKSGLPEGHGYHLDKVLAPTPKDAVKPQDILTPSQIIDITDKLDPGGKLNWNAPAGRWTILRMGRMSTASFTRPGNKATTGLDVDKLSKEAVKFHFDHMCKPLLEMKNVLPGKGLKYFGVDSWEAGAQNWSPVLPREFQKRRGYSLYPWLPVLTGRVVGSVERSERFLWDFRRTIADCIHDSFFSYLTQLTEDLGMKFEAECFTRATFDGSEVAEAISIPVATFWQFPGRESWGKFWNLKWASSAAHVSGARVTSAEAFPAAPADNRSAWVNHPWNLKQRGDNMLCSGVNHFLFHCFALQPWADKKVATHKPGMIFKNWGTQYSQHNTWWEQSLAWHQYLSRCYYLLQQGNFSAEVLYMTAEEAPGNEKETARSVRLSFGYDWDLCSSRAVKEKLSVENGELRLPSGMRYRLLVLPTMQSVTPALLEKVKTLLSAGGHVLISSRPERAHGLSGYPESDQKVVSLVNELWQDLDGRGTKERSYGKGKLYWGVAASDVLKKLGVEPDMTFTFAGPDRKWFQYIHRYTEQEDIYFIAANRDKTPAATFSFRVSGKVPEFWYPDTGAIEKCTVYRTENGRTEIPILFDQFGSVFVVFRDGEPSNPATSVAINGKPVLSTDGAAPAPGFSVFARPGTVSATLADGTTTEEAFDVRPSVALDTDWTARFPEDSGAPASVPFKTLIPWNEHPDESIRYFSGTAVYSRSFECDLSNRDELWLDLGSVEVISEVSINAEPAGVLWKPPFRTKISSLVRPGTNTIEVRVANLWVNRLIGDERFPRDFEADSKGYVRVLPQWLVDDKPRPEKRRRTFTTYLYYRGDEPLLPSGLIGPVNLMYTPKMEDPKLQEVSNYIARHCALPDGNKAPSTNK